MCLFIYSYIFQILENDESIDQQTPDRDVLQVTEQETKKGKSSSGGCC